MMASYASEDVTPQQWWDTISTQAAAFFHLLASDNLPTTPAVMTQLKTAQERFNAVEAPPTMIRVRQHLLWAMRYLQMSVAEGLAQRPDKSRQYQQQATDDYHKACAILESCGVRY